MKILSIECSASPASAAIVQNGKILGNTFVNIKLTHSQTLMPMIKALLSSTLTNINDIGGIAVAAGPGSFTGIRIGISAAKGLAQAHNLPCVAVSTLRAMAENFIGTDCYVCATMDARCNQVYNAIFDISNGTVTRICQDRALMCDELANEISKLAETSQKDIIVCGDGTDLFFEFVKDIAGVKKVPELQKYQNAIGVALCAVNDFENGNTVTPSELLPTYLRLPQAERELKAKQDK